MHRVHEASPGHRRVRSSRVVATWCATVLIGMVGLAGDETPVDRDTVRLPAGEFMMSALDQGTGQFEADGVTRRPATKVVFAKPMRMSRTEITQGDFQSMLGRNPSKFRDGPDAPLRPVECVTLFDAAEYCNARSKRDGLAPRYALDRVARRADGSIEFAVVKDLDGEGWRLPTEAEWEYACRAGTTTAWSWGDDELAIGGHSWSRDQSAGSTHPVATKKANPWGLFDMHGNVFEWCFDPKAKAGDPHAFRGGSWFNCPVCAKSESRSATGPASREATLGFRVMRDVGSGGQTGGQNQSSIRQ
jgi:formylglycine-generating enzyme required for sulfatase activity